MADVKAQIKNGKLFLELPVSERPSKSGKTTVVASSNGNIATECQYKGKPLVVGCNAYVK